LESRRLDKIEESIIGSADPSEMLAYCLTLCNEVVFSRDFRTHVSRDREKQRGETPCEREESARGGVIG